ncbi:MAG: GntR family transcriptional regulator [Clostridia bacterium]
MSNNKTPLYEKIFNHYKEKILSGELEVGNRLPSENAIAQTFSVSRITVSRAFKELERAKLIRRVKGSGSYVKNMHQGSTKDSNHDFISLILPSKGDFSSEILKGIEEVAMQNDYFVTYHNSSESPELEKELVLEIMSRGSAGFIAYPVEPKANMDLYSKLLISGYPFVVIDRKIQGLDTSLVWTDNQKGTYDMTSHLLKTGHTRIIFLGYSVFEISSETERYRGFCKAHIDHGVPLLHRNLYGTEKDTRSIPADYMPGAVFGIRACNYLFDLLETISLAERPTAIVAVNDYIASILVSAAIERDISIPADYSITGFDDLPYAAHLPVPLTTVAQPARQIGRLAASELFIKINNPGCEPKEYIVEAEIVVRKSTASI